ncbi:MAG: three-Cys-motif partner protein TcmP [Bacteroidales bacterium]|nr:three-Cys-motif partner protein TcmP [Bacteroidales bacterium]
MWTKKKLDSFINYVKAYTTILNKVKGRYGWKTIYFDGFAGCGEIDTENEKCGSKPKGFFDDNDYSLYQGSVSRILELPAENQFDFYYFIDKNKEYISELNKIKDTLPTDLSKRVNIRLDDCNNQLTLLSKAIKRGNNFASLVLLDPFGMQINWESISQLKDTRSDIWILVPSGVAINRLLDKKMELKQIDKLEKFFGSTIRNRGDFFIRLAKDHPYSVRLSLLIKSAIQFPKLLRFIRSN